MAGEFTSAYESDMPAGLFQSGAVSQIFSLQQWEKLVSEQRKTAGDWAYASSGDAAREKLCDEFRFYYGIWQFIKNM